MRILAALLVALVPMAIAAQTAATLQRDGFRDAANYVGFAGIAIGLTAALFAYVRRWGADS